MAGLTTLGSSSYFVATDKFGDGSDSPRAFLERCFEAVDAFESEVGAFVATNFDDARANADAASVRWQDGAPLSQIDGMPVGIKDIMETKDMVTEQGSPLFKDWQGRRDSAAVAALREAGAVILGKTVTTEFASSHPRSTRNPWDLKRTPGGSSSGSAAGVAAGMFPAALGTQVIGSILRPASFCGCFGYKPSVGGINRGGSFDDFSQSCSGTLAVSLAEGWAVAREISARCGGDPGYPGIYGPLKVPNASMPLRLARLETAGWTAANDVARQSLGQTVDRLAAAGVAIFDRTNNSNVAAVELALAEARDLSMAINAWEGRWPLNTYARDMDRSALSKAAQERLATAEEMTQEEYQKLIVTRKEIRNTYANLAADFDACVTLAAPGAAPIGIDWTGDPTFVVPGSLLGVPALSLPVLEDNGLPLGLQLLGYQDRDADLFAAAGAILEILPPISLD